MPQGEPEFTESHLGLGQLLRSLLETLVTFRFNLYPWRVNLSSEITTIMPFVFTFSKRRYSLIEIWTSTLCEACSHDIILSAS